jgi:uncharacterized protein
MEMEPASDALERATNRNPEKSDEPQAVVTDMLELSREECLSLLASHRFGRLVVSTGAGHPVIRPVNYVFDDRSQSVAFRTAPGSKLHALIRSAQAAFEIDEVDEGSQTGWSVIIRGVTHEVTKLSEISRLGRLGLRSWAPGPKHHWVQIRAWTVSGRRIMLLPGSNRRPPPETSAR